MLSLLFWAWITFTFVIVCWFFYLAVMSLAARREQLGVVAKAFAYYGLALGYALDLVLTLIVGTVLFMEPPRELTLTMRLKRLKAGTGWRARLASAICEKLLNQFDPDGKHC